MAGTPGMEVGAVEPQNGHGSLNGRVVCRVRQLLADYGSAVEAAPELGDVGEASCLPPWQAEGLAGGADDLEEIQSRLSRLKNAFPDLGEVEVNPLVAPVRRLLSRSRCAEAISAGDRAPETPGRGN